MSSGNIFFQCPQCGRRSYSPNDIREGYCGHCRDWTAIRMEETEIPNEQIIHVGRVSTGITVVNGEQVSVVTIYSQDDTTKPERYLFFDPAYAILIAEAMGKSARSALEE